MRRLYIATTTLNFNSILASESISPWGFYATRGFGSPHWVRVPENDWEKSLLLYEEHPLFERPVGDTVDYPLVISIEAPEALRRRMVPVAEGVYRFDGTIYLDWKSTEFLFAEKQHRQVALSRSEGSLETKLVARYRAHMHVRPGTKRYERVAACQPDDIALDQRINRMKGCLYGYFIGGLLSTDKESVEELNRLLRIKDLLAAIRASISMHGAHTPEQENLLRKLVSNSESANRCLSVLSQKEKKDGGENPAMAWINKGIEQANEGARARRNQVEPSPDDIALGVCPEDGMPQLATVACVPEGKPRELFLAIVNEVLTQSQYNGKVSSFNNDLADAITLKAKEVYGTEWEGEASRGTRDFLNALRHHLRGEEFTQSWETDWVLSSLAAVVLKGDEWERLLAFMRTKGMHDYRLAFALYGTLNGFANLTRDFTDLLLEEEDPEYRELIYRFIQQQLELGTGASGGAVETGDTRCWKVTSTKRGKAPARRRKHSQGVHPAKPLKPSVKPRIKWRPRKPFTIHPSLPEEAIQPIDTPTPSIPEVGNAAPTPPKISEVLTLIDGETSPREEVTTPEPFTPTSHDDSPAHVEKVEHWRSPVDAKEEKASRDAQEKAAFEDLQTIVIGNVKKEKAIRKKKEIAEELWQHKDDEEDFKKILSRAKSKSDISNNAMRRCQEWQNSLMSGVFYLSPKAQPEARPIPEPPEQPRQKAESATTGILSGEWIGECGSLMPDSRSKKSFIDQAQWFIEQHLNLVDSKTGKVVPGRYANEREYPKTTASILEHLINYLKDRQTRRKIPMEVNLEPVISLLRERYGNQEKRF